MIPLRYVSSESMLLSEHSQQNHGATNMTKKIRESHTIHLEIRNMYIVGDPKLNPHFPLLPGRAAS